MELAPITLPLFNSVPVVILSMFAVVMLLMSIASFTFGFPIAINCKIPKLEQIKQSDLPLSEFQYRTDNKEHEYKIRIDRKRSLVYSKDF